MPLIRLGLRLAPLLSAAWLAGCGFQPLYATGGVAPSLRAIEVEAPQGRTAFLLKEQLDDQLARDRSVPARYRLALTVSQGRAPRGVRVNNVANQYEITVGVGYTLTEAGSGKALATGFVPVEVSYDSPDPPYAGVAAEQNGEERAATQAAVLLRLELSRVFATSRASEPRAMNLSKRADADRFLASPTAGFRIALIHGRDRGGVLERARQLAAKVTDKPDDPFDTTTLTEADLAEDPARLADELSAFSMMGGRRLIRLRLSGEKVGPEKTAAEAVKAHAEGAFNPDAFLLIESGALKAASPLRKAAEAAKAAASIAVYDDETGDVARLIRERLAADGLGLTPPALELLATRLPKERGVARQEIERLALFLGPGSRITAGPEDLADFLGVEPEASLADAALDAFGARAAEAQAGLRRAWGEGEGGVAAVRALSQQLGRLRRVAILVEAGAGAQAAAKSAGVFWKAEREFLRQLRAWRLAELDRLQPEVLGADRACKQAGSPDTLLAERLALTVAARARRLGL